MPELSTTVDEAVLRRLVGPDLLAESRRLVADGRVSNATWHQPAGRAFGQVTGVQGSRTAMVKADLDAGGAITGLISHCTCNATRSCVHAVAVLLASVPGGDTALAEAAATEPVPAVEAGPEPAAWERSLAGVLPSAAGRAAGPASEVALQFELTTQAGHGRGAAVRTRIGLRPVLPGAKGNWIKSGIAWSTINYAGRGHSSRFAQQIRLLREILALYSSAGDYYSYGQATPFLDAAPSRRIWDLLAECVELGLPLVQPGKGNPPVQLHPRPAGSTLSVGRDPGGLALRPEILVDGDPVDLSSALLLGEPAHGLAWWDDAARPIERVLRVAPLSTPVEAELRELLGQGPILVPADDAERFLHDYVPRLRQRLNVTASGDVELPKVQPPVLQLTVERRPGHQVAVSWQWVYALGPVRRTEPLRPPAGSTPDRDLAAEAGTLARVQEQACAVPGLLEDSPTGPHLRPAAVLDGIATVRLVTGLLPQLAGPDDVELVLTTGELADDARADYREAETAPVVTISGDRAADDRDWFNLAVTVSVDGEQVPFDQLFVALAQGHEHLVLTSGTYFSLERDEFRRLAALIAEARALQDVENGTVRVSRFQAGLWDELHRIGVVSGQAAEWQASVQALTTATVRSEHPAPAGLKATLRPYQLAGFNWLAALYEHRLGGVLADDMGLGKTLQTLALFSHVREQGLSDRPFLVVAPTSVVFNWAAEAERFTPGLRVAAIAETRARRGSELDAAIAGADVVVTSYTLFRLEYEHYAAVDWAALVLDEAQFVKNHQSQSYQNVKRLPAPVKIAITGTPMENNLMELWSLLSITAPGLFASPARFTDYYRTPIEKDRNTELLEQLRRRIRPLMLRRTKEQVATDLPDKREQVIELELNPQHRKVYQTHLHRERQKVLGLLGDLQKNRFEIFRSLTLLRQASLDVGLIDPEYSSIPSTKLDAMMERVQDIAGEGHRTLIFSQFTRFLGSARARLEAAGIGYCYLDGSTRDRAAVLTEFKTGDAPVFLISLKAGGFGLNLTEADYVILLDPWWNPATEAQAVDRVHRIGQTKKVMVYRLVARDTIEEKVMALKAGKSALFSSVMEDGGFESAALTDADIRGLLD